MLQSDLFYSSLGKLFPRLYNHNDALKWMRSNPLGHESRLLLSMVITFIPWYIIEGVVIQVDKIAFLGFEEIEELFSVRKSPLEGMEILFGCSEIGWNPHPELWVTSECESPLIGRIRELWVTISSIDISKWVTVVACALVAFIATGRLSRTRPDIPMAQRKSDPAGRVGKTGWKTAYKWAEKVSGLRIRRRELNRQLLRDQ
jgi:hypothetical protein